MSVCKWTALVYTAAGVILFCVIILFANKLKELGPWHILFSNQKFDNGVYEVLSWFGIKLMVSEHHKALTASSWNFLAFSKLIWPKCYPRNRWLQCLQTWRDNLLHTTDWFSAIIIFHVPNSLMIIILLLIDCYLQCYASKRTQYGYVSALSRRLKRLINIHCNWSA